MKTTAANFPRRTIKLRLPWPPSANRIWRRGVGKTFLSPKYRAFKTDVAAIVWDLQRRHSIKPICVNNKNVLVAGKIAVGIILHPPTRRNRDVDNCIKPILDALQSANVFADDADVWLIWAKRGSVVKGGYAEVKIAPFFDKKPRQKLVSFLSSSE